MKNLKNKTKRLCACALSGALVLTAPGVPLQPVFATEAIEAEQQRTNEEIDDVSQKRKEAVDETIRLQDNAQTLTSELSSYTKKLEDVNRKIEDTKNAITDTEEDIATLEGELTEARTAQDEQYRRMKDRISYFYQKNMGRNIVTVFLECRSIADIINSLVYLDAVMSYDRDMLHSFEEAERQIAAKQEELQTSKDSLVSYQDELTVSQGEMDELVGLKQGEAAEAAAAVSVAQLSVEEFNQQLAVLMQKKEDLQAQADAAQAELARQITAQLEREAQERQVESQESAMQQREAEEAERQAAAAKAAAEAAATVAADAEQRAIELANAGAAPEEIDAASQAAVDARNAATEAERRAEEQQKNAETVKNGVTNTGGTYTGGSVSPGSVSLSESDILMMAACIQAEADNQGDTGRLAVASVIMNRVESNKFPNTVPGVIQQNMQFATWRSGAVSLILQRGPNENYIRAARQAAAGQRLGTGLFFMTKPAADGYGITGYEKIGDHVFFWKWGANP